MKLLIYFLESGICLALFYLLFYFFLKKNVYFFVGRFFLLISLIVSLIIPLIEFDIGFQNRSIDKIQYQTNELIYSILYNDQNSNDPLPINPILNSTEKRSQISPYKDLSNTKQRFDSIVFLFFLYLLGVFFFSIRFIVYLFKVFKIIFFNRIKRQGKHYLVLMEIEESPFSFLNFIFINKSITTNDDLEKMMAHERIHVSQFHSLDLILLELLNIFQWFNPIIYLYKRSIKELHEYLADQGVVKQGYDSYSYKQLLLKQVFQNQKLVLINGFNQSLTKRRLMTINKNIERKSVFLRLSYVIPATLLLTFFVTFIFQCSKNNIDEKAVEKHYQTGLTLRRNGKIVEAFKEFNAAITLNPKHFLAQKDFMIASKKETILSSQALEMYEQYIVDHPNDPVYDALLGYYHIYIPNMKLAKTKVAVDRSLSLDPNYYWTNVLMADYYTDMKNSHEAIKWYKKANSLGALDGSAYYLLGCQYVFVDSLDLAIDAFKKAIPLGYRRDQLPHQMLWTTMMKRHGGDPTIKKEISNLIDLFLKEKDDDLDYLNAALRGYRMLQDEEKVKMLYLQIKEKKIQLRNL
jgi:tetratricopeptide (TPR) repeat protein